VAKGLKHLRCSAAHVSAGNDRKVWQLALRLLRVCLKSMTFTHLDFTTMDPASDRHCCLTHPNATHIPMAHTQTAAISDVQVFDTSLHNGLW
jgi:hypothetical protein